MEERRKRALNKLHQTLRTGILVGSILPTLHLFLTDVEYRLIDDKGSNVARIDELIKILLTKDDWHFEEFCAALESNGYEHWATKLWQEVNEVEGKLTITWMDT